ncbi:MAG: hypothetical protein ACR2GY_03595 [Phycisphaerales bacterium]
MRPLAALNERIDRYEQDREGIVSAHSVFGRWGGGLAVTMVRLRVPREWDRARAQNSLRFQIRCATRLRTDQDAFVDDAAKIAPIAADALRAVQRRMWLEWYLVPGTDAPWPHYPPSHPVRFNVAHQLQMAMSDTDTASVPALDELLSQYAQHTYANVRKLDDFMAERTVVGFSREQLMADHDVDAYAIREAKRFQPIRSLLTLNRQTLAQARDMLTPDTAHLVIDRTVVPRMFEVTSDQSPVIQAIRTALSDETLADEDVERIMHVQQAFFDERAQLAEVLLAHLQSLLEDDAVREYFMLQGKGILDRDYALPVTEKMVRFNEMQERWEQSIMQRLPEQNAP